MQFSRPALRSKGINKSNKRHTSTKSSLSLCQIGRDCMRTAKGMTFQWGQAGVLAMCPTLPHHQAGPTLRRHWSAHHSQRPPQDRGKGRARLHGKKRAVPASTGQRAKAGAGWQAPFQTEEDTRALQATGSQPNREVLPVCFFKLLCHSLPGVIFLADFAQQYNSCSRAVKRSRKGNLKCRNKIIVSHEL